MYSMGFSYGVISHLSYTGVGSQYCPPDFLMLVGLGIVFSGPPARQDRCYLLDLFPSGGW